MTRIIKSCIAFVALGLFVACPVSAYAQTQLATGKPTVFKVTVTKMEIFNGTSFVTIFTGSSQLDLVAAAGTSAFPGISALTLAAGTYTQIRVTFSNTFTFRGSLASGGTTYYTTAATINSNSGSVASTSAAALADATILNPTWGALGDPVVQTMTIPSQTITRGTSYAPTLKFDVTNSMVLSTLSGTIYFTLASMTVTML